MKSTGRLILRKEFIIALLLFIITFQLTLFLDSAVSGIINGIIGLYLLYLLFARSRELGKKLFLLLLIPIFNIGFTIYLMFAPDKRKQ